MEKVTLKNKHGLPRLAALALVMVLSTLGTKAFADVVQFVEGGVKYEVTDAENKYVKVIGNEYTGSVTIPKTVSNGTNTYTVTTINDWAFYNRTEVTSVTIGENVISIGAKAFSGCTGMSSVGISKNVTSIGEYAFENCKSLTSAKIPSGVTDVSSYAFCGCSSLASVTFEGNDLKSIGGSAFERCGKLTSIEIPNSVTSIGSSAFKQSGLTSIVIPDNVTSIGKETFYACSSLKTVVVGESVKEIGESAFSYYTGLETITFKGDKLESIGKQAFDYCTTLKKVIIADIKSWCGVAFAGSSSNPLSVAYHLYLTSDENNEVTELNIPDGVTKIGDYAFCYCTGLTKVTGGKDLTSIGKGAFQGCDNITEFPVCDNVISIGNYAFSNCKQLTSINIPDGITTIGADVFAQCHSLKSVSIPSSVKTIGGSAFAVCTGLTSVVIPEGVTEIGSQAFVNCTSLTSIEIPSTVTKIDYYAFNTNKALTKVISHIQTPSNATVSEYAFDSNVKKNTTLYVPEGTVDAYKAANVWKVFANIKEIPITAESDGVVIYYQYTDESKTALKVISGMDKYTGAVKIPEKANDGSKDLPVTAIDEKAFYQCTGLTSIVIGSNVTSIGGNAFNSCEKMTSVEIPSSVTSIGNTAFTNCIGLKKVVVKDIAAWCGITFVSPQSNPLVFATHLYGSDDNEVKDLVIPEGVTSIGGFAFDRCVCLTSVSIPNNVTSIGTSAFQECGGLTSISIPESVTSIGDGAFYGCNNLATVTILNTAPPALGNNAFNACGSLATIYVPAGCGKTYKATDGWKDFEEKIKELPITAESDGVMIYYQYTDDSKTALEVIKGEGYTAETIKIPAEVTVGENNIPVTSIDASAFQDCADLTSVSIGSSVKSVGNGAFYGCTGLESVTIPDNVETIGSDAFSQCSGLTSVSIGSGVKSIGEQAFHGCTNLTKVSSNIQAPPAINSNVFYTSTLTNGTLYVPKGTKEAYAAAEGWKEFTNIDDGTTDEDEDTDEDKDEDNPDDEEKDDEEEKPDEDEVVTTLEYNLINGGTALEVTKREGGYSGNIKIPAEVDNLPVIGIGDEAFEGCTGVKSVDIPRSVTTIGDGAFSGCSSLEAITIRSTVEAIGAGAFGGCTALKKIIAEDIPAWCSISFGDETANPLSYAGHIYSDEKTEITDLVISEQVEKIGAFAFANCIGLRSVTISGKNPESTLKSDMKSESYYDGVKEIGNSAFYACVNITEVSIPSSMESIEESAFRGCLALTTVTSNIGEPFVISSNVFDSAVEAVATLNVPKGTKTAYGETAGWKEFLTIKEVGSSTGIEDIIGENVTIQSNGGALNIRGVKDGTRVVVYSMTGAMIGSGNVACGTASIPTALRKGDIAIVRIGDTAVKVMIK